VRFRLDRIEMDTSIQCRAQIDVALVNEYADRMAEGADFPAVVLFGTAAKAWIGDGWHRVLGAKQTGAETIRADLSPGGRAEALKHALGANAVHGHRRTNADKRRAVEIALREFPRLSSNALSKLCGVSDMLVTTVRGQVQEVGTCATVTGADGKSYPAKRDPAPAEPVEETESEESEPEPRRGPHPDVLPKDQQRPRNGMQFARMAIRTMQQIDPHDEERSQALNTLEEWVHVQDR